VLWDARSGALLPRRGNTQEVAGSLLARERGASSPGVAVVVLSVFAMIFSVSGRASRGADAAAMVTHSLNSVDGVRCSKVAFPDEPAAPMPDSAIRALARLAHVESASQVTPLQAGMSGMSGTGQAASVGSMPRAERDALISELRRATTASCHLLSITDAESAGYYLGSPYVEGVGTHWINWAYVDRPFDPARPSMLLFKTSGAVTQLAGFSYWVRSAAEPEGFTGPTDHWHRHSGLCFVAGQWAGEGLVRAECKGVWLNGRDLWMLHAWIVPDHENPAGVFAPLSRELCRPHIPDIAACPRHN
jgi:hypothetical protein